MDLLQTSQVVELLNDTDTNWWVDLIRLSFTIWKFKHSMTFETGSGEKTSQRWSLIFPTFQQWFSRKTIPGCSFFISSITFAKDDVSHVWPFWVCNCLTWRRRCCDEASSLPSPRVFPPGHHLRPDWKNCPTGYNVSVLGRPTQLVQTPTESFTLCRSFVPLHSNQNVIILWKIYSGNFSAQLRQLISNPGARKSQLGTLNVSFRQDATKRNTAANFRGQIHFSDLLQDFYHGIALLCFLMSQESV